MSRLKEAEEFEKSFRRKPIKTVVAIILILIALAITAYVTGFFGEKGRRNANSSKEQSLPLEPSKEKEQDRKDQQVNSKQKIDQSTKGDRSPAVITNGDVTIIYDSKEGEGKKQ